MSDEVRTALFVDFDQVYSGLYREWPAAAEQFAIRPEVWLRFLERGLHAKGKAGSIAQPRSVLLRRCYLNPVGAVRGGEMFSRFRAFFTRAAFTVVDCPPLTSQGKNSADIVMVMDILDALEHRTHFDEFVVLSGDADFTPVLHRLRAHDRRSSVLADSRTTQVYRAAADNVIRHEAFITIGLGMELEEREATRAPAGLTQTQALQRGQVLSAVRHVLAHATGPVPIDRMGAEVVKLVPEVGAGRWPGATSLAGLLRTAGDPHIALAQGGGAVLDPHRHVRHGDGDGDVVPDAQGDVARERVDAMLGRVVGVPVLASEAYRVLFRHLAAILRAAGEGRAVPQTMQAAILQARCAADGQEVPRDAAGFVLAMLPADVRPPAGDAAEAWLAGRFRAAVLDQAAAAGLVLDEAEAAEVEAWLVGP